MNLPTLFLLCRIGMSLLYKRRRFEGVRIDLCSNLVRRAERTENEGDPNRLSGWLSLKMMVLCLYVSQIFIVRTRVLYCKSRKAPQISMESLKIFPKYQRNFWSCLIHTRSFIFFKRRDRKHYSLSKLCRHFIYERNKTNKGRYVCKNEQKLSGPWTCCSLSRAIIICRSLVCRKGLLLPLYQ